VYLSCNLSALSAMCLFVISTPLSIQNRHYSIVTFTDEIGFFIGMQRIDYLQKISEYLNPGIRPKNTDSGNVN